MPNNPGYKVSPHNTEAEMSLLGSVFIDQNALIKVADFLMPEYFYNPAHREVFSVMLELFEERKPLDIITISNGLKKRKALTKIGGIAYLTKLANSVPTASNVEEYAEIVKESGVRRRLIDAAARINEWAFDEDNKLQQTLDSAEKELFDISRGNIKQGFVSARSLLKETYERAAEIDKQGELLGIPTGFKDIDKLLGGFQPSDLIILAARPSVGKTALSLDMALHAAVAAKKRIGYFSLEMSSQQLMERLLSMQAKVSFWDLRTGNLKDESFERIADAMGELSESELYIDDRPGQHIMEIRTKARRLQMEHGVDMIVVDYMQLIRGDRSESRVLEVSDISMSLKNLARELNVPVIALSQLSRAVESRDGKRPQLSDLRDSGSIEQDADVVMFIHREERYNPDTERKGIADIIVAKHRNGPVGDVELAFVQEQARFADLAHYKD